MTPASKLIAQKHRRDFAAEVAGPGDALRLDLAALLIAAEDEANANVDVAECLRRLAGLGEQARGRVAAAPGAGVEAFNEFIFGEVGLKGNELDYYDPRNSFLNHVLERRTGIPITLSVVYMEVGRRAGLSVEGIGMPGHFIVRASEQGQVEATLVDAFHARIIGPEDCQDRLDEIYGGQVALSAEHLRSVNAREILVRMLTNLKGIYMRAGLDRQALAAVERILLVMPEAAGEHRDGGALLARLDRLPEAIAELQAYLNMAGPQAPELDKVREQLQTLRRQHAMRN